MKLISLIKKKASLIVTPIQNIDFHSKEIIDQSLIIEVEVKYDSPISFFNLTSQSHEKVCIHEIKEHHWYSEDNVFYKILHIMKDN